MGVFYNSLKSLRALVCEREKNLSIIHFGTGFPRRKVFCRKKKCLKVNAFSLADAKTYIYCLLLCDITYWFCEQWATMYEFNLHNILYRRKKCVCPSSVIFFFFKQPWFASIMTLSKTFSHLNFLNAYNAILKFQLICNQTPRFTIGDCAAGHRADNRDKNRNVLIVPRKLNLFVTNSNFRVKSNLLKSIFNMCNTTEL